MGLARGGGRAARALRLLLLVIMALAAVEYLFGSILEASPLKTYLYSTSSTTDSVGEKQRTWIKKFPIFQTPEQKISMQKNATTNANIINNRNITVVANTSTNYNEITINSIIETVRNESNPLLLELINSLQNLTAEKAISNNTHANNTLSTKAAVTTNKPEVIKIETVIIKKEKSVESANKTTTDAPSLPYCETPQDLGPLTVNKSELALEYVERRFPGVQWGGFYSPPDCIPRHKVAIIVPFRDRQQHLTIFLNHMHGFLMKQKIEYGIFIIEPKGKGDFNRAKLMNVGFVESEKMKKGGWNCFIFHDVDLLPLDSRNLYTCPRQPRHMSAAVDKFKYKLPYSEIFGGVSAMTKEQFKKVNGFSNKFWGWGGEDDDMFNRLKKNHYFIARYKMSIARYTMLEHKKSSPNPRRYQLLQQGVKSYKADGLSTLEYELEEVCQNQLYTHIIADISEKS